MRSWPKKGCWALLQSSYNGRFWAKTEHIPKMPL